MKTTPTTTELQHRARELYRRSGPRVDAAVAGRLRAARRQALNLEPARRRLRWMVPAGACAAALLAALTIWQPLRQSLPVATTAPATSGQLTNNDVLPPDADQTDPALYQHMDFYAWLASQQPAESSHGQ